MKYMSFGVVGVLVVLAIVLGGAIYQQQTGSKSQTGIPQDRSVPQPVANQNTQQASTPRELTAEEKQALNFPGPNATEAEKKAHADLVNKLGNQSGVPFLDISGCRPTPVVYRVKLGGTFKVKNSDSKDHTIYTDRDTVIKANSEQTLTSKDIGDNLGQYAYGCDGSAGSGVGIIQITP